MLRTPSANKDQVHLVLCWLREVDSLVMAAPLAQDILSSGQGGVLDALGVNLKVLSPHREIGSVDAVVHLGELVGPLVIVTQFADELEELVIFRTVLLRI